MLECSLYKILTTSPCLKAANWFVRLIVPLNSLMTLTYKQQLSNNKCYFKRKLHLFCVALAVGSIVDDNIGFFSIVIILCNLSSYIEHNVTNRPDGQSYKNTECMFVVGSCCLKKPCFPLQETTKQEKKRHGWIYRNLHQ